MPSVIWLPSNYKEMWKKIPHGACHSSSSTRCEDVGQDPVALSLDSKTSSEANDSSLSGWVLKRRNKLWILPKNPTSIPLTLACPKFPPTSDQTRSASTPHTHTHATKIWKMNSQIPTPEAVVKICPYFCFWKISHTALQHLYVPFRCTAMMLSHSFSPIVVKDLSQRIPAFTTRACTPPNASRVTLTIDPSVELSGNQVEWGTISSLMDLYL